MQTEDPKLVYVLFRKKKQCHRDTHSWQIMNWEIYVGMSGNFQNRLDDHSRLNLDQERSTKSTDASYSRKRVAVCLSRN
jgi:hypothetical protein